MANRTIDSFDFPRRRIESSLKLERQEEFDVALGDLFINPIGTIDASSDITLSELDCRTLIEDWIGYYIIGSRVDALVKLMATEYDEAGRRNSKKILSYINEKLEAPPPPDTVSRFISAWAACFKLQNAQYQIAWSVNAFRGLGETCEGDSCFRQGGQYAYHPILLYVIRPSFVIYIWTNESNTKPTARCWGYYDIEKDTIYLSNYYYGCGCIQTSNLFSHAVKEATGRNFASRMIIGASNLADSIGVYCNGNIMILSEDPSMLQDRINVFRPACPSCGKDAYEFSICGTCEGAANEEPDYCWVCDYDIYEDDNRMTVNGRVYCESCYDEVFTTCDECERTIDRDDAVYTESGNYCEGCVPLCSDCGTVLLESDEQDEDMCCDCAEKRREEDEDE